MYDDGFHVLVSRRYDNNLDFVFSSAILFCCLFILLYYALMGMIFYGEDCKKFLVIFKELYSSADLVGICGRYYIAVKMPITKSDPPKAYDRYGYSVKVECPRSVDKAYNITNWLIYSDSRARLTVLVNKQYNYIQDDNQSNKTGGISTGKKKYIAGG